MPDSHALLLSVVTRLLDDPVIPARLLALGDAAAVLAMADGSLAALFTPAYGPPEELGAKLRSLVQDNPGAHLKLVIVGGNAAMREQLPRDGGGLLSRRAVQTFHLGPDADREWVLWTGGGGRPDSPLGKVLAAAGRGELPAPPEPATLAERVDRPPPPSPEERARVSEGQAFIASLAVRPRATWGLLGVLAVIFVLEELWGGSETVPTLVRMGGNTEATLVGEPWRLLSSALLHAGWFHVAVNGFVLLVLGGFLERVLGVARYGVLLGTAAVGGSLASALVSSAPLSVGASGAIWGVLGAAAALSWRPGQVIPAVMVGPLRRNAMINVILNLAASFLPQIDVWAHLGGGLVGAALVLGGVLTRGLVRPGSAPAAGSTRGFAIAAGLMAVVAGASLTAAWITGRPWSLVAEPTWARHTLGGVSVEVPALLGEPERVSDDGLTVWAHGDLLRDPLVLTVSVATYEPASEEQLALRIRSYEEEGIATPEGAHVRTAWHRRPGDGPAAFEVEYGFDDRYVMTVSLHAFAEASVRVESIRWASTSKQWAAPTQRIHASPSLGGAADESGR